MLTENISFLTSLTVRLIPSIDTEPFAIIYFSKLPSIELTIFIAIIIELPSFLVSIIFPMPSTCPRTKCPEISELTERAGSILTISFTFKYFSADALYVVGV